MNLISCREMDDALAAYACDALEENDRLAAVTHLAECRNHDAEFKALRETLAALASTEPVEPPPQLRSALLDAFDKEFTGAAAPALASQRAEGRPGVLRRPRPAYAAAAALLVVAVMLGVWGATRGGGTDVLLRAADGPHGTLALTYIEGQGLGVIEVDLVQPPAGEVYQAWRIDSQGGASSLGVLTAFSGRVVLQGDLREAVAIALSLEPQGGSEAPTSEPLLLTNLD